jgi:putative tryptophan/tyrosine transport system substrate-binding protein
MTRLTRLAGLLLAFVLALPPAPAATEERPFRIVLVTWRGWTDTDEGFKDHFERRRIPVELTWRDAGGDAARLAEIVKEIRTIEPDLVYAWGTSVALGVVGRVQDRSPDRHIIDIPVVFCNVTDPIHSGIVESGEPTRTNVTGSFFVVPLQAQLSTIQSYRPIERLGVIFNPLENNAVITVEELRRLAPEFGMTLLEFPVEIQDGEPSRPSVPRLVAEAASLGVEFLYVPPDSFLSRRNMDLGEAALRHRLPIFGAAEGTLGGSKLMMGLINRYYTIGQLAAWQAERILVHGEDPGTMPIENLPRFSLVLNMQTVRELGLFPPMLMLRVAEVM